MKLTPENRALIDALPYSELLRRWRFVPAGDEWFQGETGSYWAARMAALRAQEQHAAVSKMIGWEKP